MYGLKGFAAALMFGLAAAHATGTDASTMVNVSWGDQKASVGTVRSAGSGADFYDYSDYLAHVPFELNLGTVYAFVHEETGSGALSLGMITTGSDIDPRDCTGVPNTDKCISYLSGWMYNAPTSARTTVMDGDRNVYGDEDVAGERWSAGANGRYYVSTFTTDSSGFILEGLAAGDSIGFGFWRLVNFDNLVFVSGSERAFEFTRFAIGDSLPKLLIDIEAAAPETLALPAVPLPAGMILLLSALGIAGVGLRRSRQG